MKLYVLVRKNMTPSQRAVQGGHAVAEFLLNSKNAQEWRNSTLVYLGVKGEHQLKNWIRKIEYANSECIIWREPDMDNQITSIAIYSDGEIFKNLNLL